MKNIPIITPLTIYFSIYLSLEWSCRFNYSLSIILISLLIRKKITIP